MQKINLKFYQEITLIPIEEININFLMNKVFCNLHNIFVQYQQNNFVDIGISFPHYEENKLGEKIRIFFMSQKRSEEVNLQNKLRKFDDYIDVTNLIEVPETDKFAVFSRKQYKGNKIKLARRQAKRKNISLEEAIEKYDNYEKELSKLPYLDLKSGSNGNTYKLFIQRKEKPKNEGFFNTFGLSNINTVPIF